MMLWRGRPLTWSFIRYGLHHFNLTRPCSSSPLHTKDGKWVENMTMYHMLGIEKNWKEKIAAENVGRQTNTSDQKYYVLSMFPYPSGKLHMGHVRVYVISDLMARYHRMLGHKVIHPMGWDAFGLPAENAAIERNLDPKDWTYSNIEMMKSQMDKLLCSFDWDTEVVTCDPAYYKWTQYIFLKMFEKGLVYQKEAEVNWDPVDKTVLADEQIDDKGCSWRSGAVVEKRHLTQWYIRSTKYAKSLLDGLDTVKSELWRDVIQLQRNWIGECTGCQVEFELLNNGKDTGEALSVYMEHPECIYGISFLALSMFHVYNKPKFHKSQDGSKVEESPDMLLTLEAVNPVSGRHIPVVVAIGTSDKFKDHDTYVGIPCVSQGDKEIAGRMGLSWLEVLDENNGQKKIINSGQFDGLSVEQGKEAVMKLLQDAGSGGYPVSSHLKDWLISRQRYWGTPIPMVHCPTCKVVPVPFEDLPVILPEQTSRGSQASINSNDHQASTNRSDHQASNDTDVKIRSPLLSNKDWLEVKCPKCGGPAIRESDTMDTFVDSTWYFYRYLDPLNQTEPFSRQAAEANMPVDLYIGGKEHAYMHLYYARFVSHFLCDLGMTSHREPFETLLTQGMVKAKSYTIKSTGVYVPPSEVQKSGSGYIHVPTNQPVEGHNDKMSKSKHNGVDPEDLLQEYGIDLTRLCILSNVAPKSDRTWNTNVYLGVHRWLNRVWNLVCILVKRNEINNGSTFEKITIGEQEEAKIKQFRNSYLMEIKYHLDTSFLINVAISRMHEISRDLRKIPPEVAQSSVEYERAVADLVIMIAPFAPMFSSEMWRLLSKVMLYNQQLYRMDGLVLEQPYPEPDADTDVVIDVNCNGVPIGKCVEQYSTFCDITKDHAFNLVKGQDFYRQLIGQKTVSKVDLAIMPRFRADLDLKVPQLDEAMRQIKMERELEARKKKREKKQAKESKAVMEE